jgi:hypothetical protein
VSHLLGNNGQTIGEFLTTDVARFLRHENVLL